MNYTQYEVCEELQPFVKCYWSLEAPAETVPEKQRIVPDGCMEMIFHYGDQYKQYTSTGETMLQPRCFVFGQIITPLEIEPTGISGIIAARFQPEGFFPFASLPLAAMNDRAIPLAELFERDTAISFEERVLHADNNADRVKLIGNFLLGKVQTTEAITRIASAAVQVLLESKGQHSIDEISDRLQVNRRQLERKFSEATGMSPKQFSKISRLQAALKLIGQGAFNNLTDLALEAGYYDQAHFIKDFREFTGVSPKQFYADSLKLSALFMQAG
jgi:AraC-like DNA-binding protein